MGFYRKGSGKPSITWPESVDEALCYGWIDGIRKTIDAQSYSIRFTPRRPDSHWSAINIRRVKELSGLGLMRKAGFDAFDKRIAERSQKASYEQRSVSLDSRLAKRFRKDARAWSYFEACPPYYKRQCTWWIMSGKKKETRERRLSRLMEFSHREDVIPPFRRPGKKRFI